MASKRSLALIALAGLLALSGALSAQTDGKLSGEVVDENGKPLQDVAVTVKDVQTEKELTSTTNRRGRFTMVILDTTRDYVIGLEKPGYAPTQEPLALETGGTTRKSWMMLSEETAARQQAQRDEISAIEGRNKAAKAYNAGAQAYNSGDLEVALTHFQEALAENDELALAHGGMVQIYLQPKNFEEAAASAQRSLPSASASSSPRSCSVCTRSTRPTGGWATRRRRPRCWMSWSRRTRGARPPSGSSTSAWSPPSQGTSRPRSWSSRAPRRWIPPWCRPTSTSRR
jgi:hypothetical protein